jgi:polysaccharide biosynthesis transport protein
MELNNFLKFLYRYKLILILVPVITAVAAWFLIRMLPDSYRSRARLATGLADQADAVRNVNTKQESQINQEFNNIIQTMLLKKTLNQVSYQLILHDLTSATPFRKKGREFSAMDDTEKKKAIQVFSEKYANRQDLSPSSPDENKLIGLLESMKYDHESLQKKLPVYRVNNSDFIDMEFSSENPQLSAFVLNTLSKEFITYYTSIVKESNTSAVAYLDSLVRQKQDTLRKKTLALRNYKIRNGILDVNDQASTLISQIADFENKRQEARKNIGAYAGALKNIDSKFDPTDRKYLESSTTRINQDIVATRQRLTAINNDYIKSNFNPSYRPLIDSLQDKLAAQIDQTNDQYSVSPLSSKKDLLQEKLNLEISLQLAENSVASLDAAINQLNGRLHGLVPNQANLQTMQEEINHDTDELTDLTRKLNDAKMQASFSVKLRQVEAAVPGQQQSSKKALLVLLAAFLSFAICVVVLFIIFFLDRSVRDVRQLANATGIPVMGQLNLLNDRTLDLATVWDKNNNSESLKTFKTQLRSIRFEVDNVLKAPKVIAVTSLGPDEGKTFFALNLAYSYAIINKKVLLIDGNFDDSEITNIYKPSLYLEDYLNGKDLPVPEPLKNITVLGNKGDDLSLLELNDQVTLQTRLEALKSKYDIIILEIPSLDAHNKAKEWIAFADKVIPVFEAGEEIKETKKDGVAFLNSLNGKMIGWVFNKAKAKV